MSALMVLSFASCNDFLDKEPEGKVPEEKVDYTNISNMYQPVSGVYAKIRRDAEDKELNAIYGYYETVCNRTMPSPTEKAAMRRCR